MSEIFKGRRFSNRLVFNCPKELEYRVSAAAAAEMSTRGAWLRRACLQQLRNGRAGDGLPSAFQRGLSR
jgi:hypothetical protein